MCPVRFVTYVSGRSSISWGEQRAPQCAHVHIDVGGGSTQSTKSRLAMRRGRKIAKVAMARRLALRLYWMWRKRWNYEQLTKFGAHAGQPGNPHGVR